MTTGRDDILTSPQRSGAIVVTSHSALPGLQYFANTHLHNFLPDISGELDLMIIS